jgi:CheY-like chemotaxis protein
MPQAPAAFRVLAIEESDAAMRLLQEAFRECGYPCDVTVVRIQAQAWPVLNRQPVNLILTHSGNGLEEVSDFVRQLRAQPRFQVVPVVLLSGIQDINGAYATGVNAFIRKSLELDEFFDKIKELVRFWREVAEQPVFVSQEGANFLNSDGPLNPKK